MVFPFNLWRSLTLAASLGVLALGFGCKGKSESNASGTPEVTISGKVTYTRIPLKTDATTGIPLGLESDSAKFQTLPLRGVPVRAFQATQETDTGGRTVNVWKLANTSVTATDGSYSIKVATDKPTFLEIFSSVNPTTGTAVGVLATSLSDTSTILADRPYYLLRKGVDGSAPAGEQTPGTTPTADATVNFAIDLTTKWWTGTPAANGSSVYIEETLNPSGSPAKTWVPSLNQESTGTGSRVAAILDSAYTFGSTIGSPTPGTSLYLHYLAGAPDLGPSFVEYDRTVYPAAWNGSLLTFFGHIRSTAANDDAWDEGVLFQLFSRNFMVSQGFTQLTPTRALDDRADLQDLRPDMALMEGLTPAIAAVLQKSPYLADTSASGVTYRDIRQTSGLGTDAYSAATISAIAWKLNLNANGTVNGGAITPVVDTPTGWATLTQTAISRFFSIVPPKDTTYSYPKDIASLYCQIARLQEAKGSDTVDLAAYFTDANLTAMLAPFSITWPRPTSTATLPDPLMPEAGFMADWGADPNSGTKALPSFTFSMANAHLNRLNQYPNFSKGEVFNARFTLSADKIYLLTVQTPSGIPANAQVEVTIGGKAYLFDAATTSVRLPALYGATTPTFQRVQVRLLSPTTLHADLPVTLRLDPL